MMKFRTKKEAESFLGWMYDKYGTHWGFEVYHYWDEKEDDGFFFLSQGEVTVWSDEYDEFVVDEIGQLDCRVMDEEPPIYGDDDDDRDFYN